MTTKEYYYDVSTINPTYKLQEGNIVIKEEELFKLMDEYAIYVHEETNRLKEVKDPLYVRLNSRLLKYQDFLGKTVSENDEVTYLYSKENGILP